MFKYVWIIMLIVMAFDVFTKYGIESVLDFLDLFLNEHSFVLAIWRAFLVVGLIALFIASLLAWNGYLE